MKAIVLKQFRSMAAELSQRPRVDVDIQLKSGTVLRAQYDILFDTVTIAGTTYPANELSQWTRLFWGSEVVRVVKRMSPVSTQAEN